MIFRGLSTPTSARNVSNPSIPLGISLFGPTTRNGSGVHVTQQNITALSAIYRAREVKAGALAASPVRAFDTDGKIQPYALFDQPHPLFTWVELIDLVETHIMFHGGAFLLKNGGRTGAAAETKSLFPLNPVRVTPKWVENSRGEIIERVYEVRMKSGLPVVMTDDEIFHIPGGGFDGLNGLSVIEQGAQSLGTSLATEEYAGKFYGEGTMASGILQTDKRLKEEEAKGLKARWRESIGGLDNAHEVIVLDNGANFQALSVDPAQAQFLESRDFNIQEVSRWTGVHPKLLMMMTEGTEVPIEQDGLQFTTFGIRSDKRRIESRFTQFIMPTGLRMDISLADFERADLKTRSGAQLLARKASTKTINDLRREDNMPPSDDPRADDLFYPVGAEGAGSESGGGDIGGETEDQGNGADGNGEV